MGEGLVMLVSLGIGLALLLVLAYEIGRASVEDVRLTRLVKAMREWHAGDPGFWHTSAVLDVMITGQVTRETAHYREQERAECGLAPRPAVRALTGGAEG